MIVSKIEMCVVNILIIMLRVGTAVEIFAMKFVIFQAIIYRAKCVNYMRISKQIASCT